MTNNLNEHELGIWYDIRDDFIDYLRVGVSEKDVSSKIIQNNSDLFNSDYSDICWLSLANVQWEYGRLDDFVKERTLNILSHNNKMFRDVYNKLNSQQPQPKKITKLKIKTPLWDIGDVIEYTINNSNSRWNGKKIYLYVEAIDETNIGTLPREEFKNTYSIFKIFNFISDESVSYFELKKYGYLKGIDYYTKEKKDLRLIAFYSCERDKKNIYKETVIIYKETNSNNKSQSLCGASFIDLKRDVNILCSYIDNAFAANILNVK